MPVLPGVQAMLDAAASRPMTGEPAAGVAARRAESDALTAAVFARGDGPGVAHEATHQVPTTDGATIRVRVYRPRTDAVLPAYAYIHGGGFWLGSIDLYDAPCRALAAAVDCVVVSIGYRLAPEHPWPTAPADCFDALGWIVEHASEIGVDPTRLAVGGGSAGGNLAAVTALLARDRGGPALAAQVLDIPVVDLTMSCPSIDTNGHGYLLTKEGMEECRSFYVPDAASWTDPTVSPLHAADLSGLPPACITTCEYDPLRDEGERYGMRLVEAGVPVTMQRALGHIHGSHGIPGIDPVGTRYRRTVELFLRAHLHPAGPDTGARDAVTS